METTEIIRDINLEEKDKNRAVIFYIDYVISDLDTED